MLDLEKYKCPTLEEVDIKATKDNIYTFMHHYNTTSQNYKNTLEMKVALPNAKEVFQEYQELETLFQKGFSAIHRPSSESKTERRREVFVKRFIEKKAICEIIEETTYSRTIIFEDLKVSALQFANALNLVVMK